MFFEDEINLIKNIKLTTIPHKEGVFYPLNILQIKNSAKLLAIEFGNSDSVIGTLVLEKKSAFVWIRSIVNQTHDTDAPIKLVGTALIEFTIKLSYLLGFEGHIALDSEKDAHLFYEKLKFSPLLSASWNLQYTAYYRPMKAISFQFTKDDFKFAFSHDYDSLLHVVSTFMANFECERYYQAVIEHNDYADWNLVIKELLVIIDDEDLKNKIKNYLETPNKNSFKDVITLLYEFKQHCSAMQASEYTRNRFLMNFKKEIAPTISIFKTPDQNKQMETNSLKPPF